MSIEFDRYIEAIQKFDVKDVTEHTYRKELHELLEQIALKGKKKLSILHEPKRKEGFGAPDFKIKTVEAIIGYIENKKITEDLNKVVGSSQIKKYTSLSDNILLTNYIEWIWLKDGEIVDRVTLCDLPTIESRVKPSLDSLKVQKLRGIILNFYSQAPKGVSRPKQLAQVLAVRSRFLRDFLNDELERQFKEHQEGRLYGLYNSFKSSVFSQLTRKEFSDAFSQTLAYGLFLSKLNAGTTTIDLYNAKKFILPAFGLITELVDFLDDLEKKEYKNAKWIVEEILSVMNTLELASITRNLSYRKYKTTNLFDEENVTYKDPYIYFYEHFLAEYDRSLRKAKGVYYTPPQIVNFIVRSIGDILKGTFGIEAGFADTKEVTVLDFATGTGTFLIEILEQVFNELPAGSGKKNLLIKEHILKNFYGFEYLIAPYTVANLKLSQFLKDQGYELEDDDRFQIYLTNTLEPINSQINIPLLPALTQEAKASQVVKDNPVLVITGNPPYAGHSKNPSERTIVVNRKDGKSVNRKVKTWIGGILSDYYKVDELPLNEQNSKWLQDDYVKFIRFAQWKMDQVNEGVVGIITNHRFISNPTFRGMRQSLMKSFDQIYILDLHGSNKPKEYCPDGGTDENVFDINQGVAISFFIKKQGLEKAVFHSDLYGLREEKYEFSLRESVDSIQWEKIVPQSPFYLFNKVDKSLEEIYNSFHSINKIFKVYGNGIVSKRDRFIIDSDKITLRQRLNYFSDNSITDTEIEEKLSLPKEDKDKWVLSEARQHLQKMGIKDELFQNVYYRPFDHRIIYADEVLVARLVKSLSNNFKKPNFALVTGRAGQNVNGEEWNLAFCSSAMTDLNLFCRGGAKTYPLYLYKENEKCDENNSQLKAFNVETEERIHNFEGEFYNEVVSLYGSTSAECIFGYIYGILYSHPYRKKYESFLKIDFPKIPLVDDKEIMQKLSSLGWDLINAHLLVTIPSVKDYPFGVFMGEGDNVVRRRDFVRDTNDSNFGRIYINNTQYFNNVPYSVWNFYIGGYQILDKYLKDRKEVAMNLRELEAVEEIIRILRFTENKMRDIEELTADWV